MKTFFRVWLGIGLISIGIGVALLIIGFSMGGRLQEAVDYTSMNESYSGIEKINMDINIGKVNIVNGNGFSITADNVLEDELKSYVKDGVWYIKDDNSNFVSFFEIKLPRRVFFWNWNDDDVVPDITITIPEAFTAEDFTLHVDAGDVKVDEINALTGEFKVDAGRIVINNLNIKDNSQYKIGAGEMILRDVTAKNVMVNCGVGNLEARGEITGKSKIKCGLGNVDLTLKGDSDAYSYDIERGIGSIDIDGKSYKNIDRKHISNNNSDNLLILDCGIGKISIEFD